MTNKIGIFDKPEVKFLVDIATEKIPVNGIWKTAIKLVLPALINGLDDRYGDRIPEPWQTYAEELITVTVQALEDKVLTEEELILITEKCATILNAEIDVPTLEEKEEAEAFLYILKSIASLIKGAVKDKKVVS